MYITINILSPVTNVSGFVVVQTRLAFQYFVFATIAEMVGRAVVRVGKELRLAGRTFYSTIDDSRFGRHEL